MNQTIYIPATEAQHTLSKIFDLVAEGNKVIFTKYGKEIGQLTAVQEKRTKAAEIQEIITFIEENAVDLGYETNLTEEIRQMRDEEY